MKLFQKFADSKDSVFGRFPQKTEYPIFLHSGKNEQREMMWLKQYVHFFLIQIKASIFACRMLLLK